MKNFVKYSLLALTLLVPTTGFAMYNGDTGSTPEDQFIDNRPEIGIPAGVPALAPPTFLDMQIELDGSLLIAKKILNNLEKITAGACIFVAAGMAYWYQTARQ